MPHISFNWVDVLFVTILIRIGYIGFRNGFLPEIFRFLGLLGAFILSFNNYDLLSSFVSTHTGWSGTGPNVASFLFILFFILIVFKICATISLLFLGKEDISKINRWAGLLVSFGRGILLTSLIYFLFVNSPFDYLSRSAEERSFLGRHVSGVAFSAYNIGMKACPWEKLGNTPLVKLLGT